MQSAFDRFFEVRLARDPASRMQAYRLRYQVYCVESGFFPPEQYPDAQEIDPYDDHSVQSLVIYRPTQAIAGTARLILPEGRGDLPGPFPFEQACDASPLFEHKLLPPASTAEISRFCFTRLLRGEIERTAAQWGDVSAREIGLLAKPALMRAVVEMTVAEGITHWCAMMEPWLVRSLEELGVRFTPFGPTVDYHGERQPCFGPVIDVLAGIRRERPDVWTVLTDGGRLCP
jgi:N-acyl amino acid synthase of PEP-CTERM/exosortase system